MTSFLVVIVSLRAQEFRRSCGCIVLSAGLGLGLLYPE